MMRRSTRSSRGAGGGHCSGTYVCGADAGAEIIEITPLTTAPSVEVFKANAESGADPRDGQDHDRSPLKLTSSMISSVSSGY
jgi:hypothetical protein